MKKHSLIAAFAAIATFASGQVAPFKIDFSPEYEYPKKYVPLGFFGSPETGYAALSYKEDKEIVIQNLDKSFVVKKTTPVDLRDYPENIQYDGVYQIGSNTWWFYSDYNKKEDTQSLSVRQVDLKNSQILNKTTELVNVKSKLIGQMEYHSYGIVAVGEMVNKFKFYYNVDRTSMLITYMLEKEFKSDKKNKDRIGLVMVDSNMNKLWGKEIQMPYFESEMSVEDYQCDSRGNAYILIKKYKTDSKRDVTKDGAINSGYEILQVNDKGSFKTINLNLENILIKSLSIYETADHNPICVGYYSEVVKKNAGIDGAFCVRIDENGKVSKYKNGTYSFPTDLLMQNERAKDARKASKKEDDGEDVQLFSLTPRKVITNADNSLIIVGEVFYTRTYSYVQNGHTYTRTTYYYEDVYLTKIEADGSLAWTKKIAKRQINTGSLGAFAMNNDCYVFFMDNANNIFLRGDQVPENFTGKKAVLTCVKINEKGDLSKSKLLDMRDEDENIYPGTFEKINDKLIISRAIKDKRTSKIMTLKKI